MVDNCIEGGAIRMRYIPKDLVHNYQALYIKVQAGGTKILTQEENIIFHKYELSNMLGWFKEQQGLIALPTFVKEEEAAALEFLQGYLLK